jgi:hypothetical protein|tara:strand:- start:7885 stop:8034 length:150 start_codon:yes stop_codon:yes gene_type:complete
MRFLGANMVDKVLDFEQVVLQAMKEWKVPGLSIAVVNGEEIEPKVVSGL